MIEIIPIDFLGQGAMLEPADRALHDEAMDFARRELKDWEKLALAQFNRCWLGRKDGEAKGLMGYGLKPDVPLFRATDFEVLQAMGQRLNGYFADNGARGREVLLYIGNEPKEARCPEWRQAIKDFGGQSARRIVFEVK